MTQAICDITTDEVNVDVVVEPQADTMVEVANRAGGMEQVFHDNTLIGNGNSLDLGVNTDVIATKEYVDEKVDSIDTYTKDQIDGKLTAVDAQIDANADAIQKTREDFASADQNIRADMNEKDSELETILNNHTKRLDTLRTDHDDLGDDVSDIQAKIPQSASGSNPLITKQQLLDEEMDIREDLNGGLSELQTQITAQAAEIATKQDQLTAGDNIVISNNVISATGAGGGAGLDMVVVDQLPETGQKGILYLVKKDGAAPDIHDEYVWIESTQTFELIGTTAVDLSGYLPTTGGTGDGRYVFKRLLDSAYTVGDAIVFAPYTTSRELEKSSIRVGNGCLQIGTNNYVSLSGSSRYIRPDTNGKWVLGGSGYSWQSIYTQKINNGADVAIPTTGGTMALAEDIEQAVNTQNLTVGSDEGALYMGVVAGTATIATNNGLDIAAQTKFDTAPTTDDNTTYADALEVSLMRKAQVATAIADAVANVDALPDQTGNAGKVLTTDGTRASWQEAPAGGTKVIIKRYS